MRVYDPATTLQRLLVAIAVLTVGYFSLVPVPLYDSSSIVQRVVVHLFAFFALSILAGFAFRQRYRRHWPRVLVGLVGLAAVLELLQFVSGVHTPSLLDLGLDIVGAALAVPAVFWLTEEPERDLPPEVDEDDPRTRVDMNQELRQQATEQGDITQIDPEKA